MVIETAEAEKNAVETKVSENHTVNTATEEIAVYSPLRGEVLPISESNDEVFAFKAMGDGVAINPTDHVVYAPADATVSLVFPTKHAIGFTLPDGVELLLHVGIDTVKLDGESFETFVNQGDKVKKGDKLLSFDRDLILKKGYQLQTMLLTTETDD